MTKEDESDLVQSMRMEMHELSQPLTTLRCRLELALMVSPPPQTAERKQDEDDVSLHGAVQGALDDLCRVFFVVERMRKLVLARVAK